MAVDPSDRSNPPKLITTGVEWRPEVDFLRSIVRRGWTVIDIGAHFGYLASLFAASVGRAGHVVAVEPEPRIYGLLQRNMSHGYEARITLVRSAVAARDGTAKLWVDKTHFRCHSLFAGNARNPDRSIDVPALTLATLCRRTIGEARIELVKIDTEGAEGLALEGADDVLDRIERIWLEFWPKGLDRAGTDPRRMLENLVENGFSLAYLDLRAKGPLTAASPSEIEAYCDALRAEFTEKDPATGLLALVYIFATRN